MNIESLFWVVHLLLMVVFAIGLVRVSFRWLQGKPQSAKLFEAPGVFPALVSAAQTLLKRLPAAASGFIIEAWLNRRLWRTNRWRWLNHSLLFNGFLLLMLLSALSVLSEKILLPWFPGLSNAAWVMVWVGRDHPLKALLNEIGSMSMTFGLLFYILRRYIVRPAQLRTGPLDTWMVVALAAILTTGWLTEAIRLNASQMEEFAKHSFAGASLAWLIRGLNLPWPALLKIQYLFHGILASLVIALIPYSKFMHAPAVGITTVMKKIQEGQWGTANTSEYLTYTARQMVELHACMSCGECVTWCPTFAEKPGHDAITPLKKIETLRQVIYRAGKRPPDLDLHAAGVYDCTLCGRCAEVCPAHIQTHDLWIAMREDLVRQGRRPDNLISLETNLLSSHNLAGDDNSQRLAWAENMITMPQVLQNNEQFETVFFTGCVNSFYPGSFSIPQAVTHLLNAAGVDYAVLGGEEWCCGFPLFAAGMQEAAIAMMRHNLEVLERSGARQLLMACPSCYRMWREVYPRLAGESLGFEVNHVVDWLDTLVVKRQLDLEKLDIKVTYHDPCDLGRGSRIYEAPRRLIQAVPGLELIEMEHHHELSLCCGGGGDVEMTDDSLVTAVANRRIREARETGAELLVTACQQCKRTLAAAARKENLRLRVMDVTELISSQAERRI